MPSPERSLPAPACERVGQPEHDASRGRRATAAHRPAGPQRLPLAGEGGGSPRARRVRVNGEPIDDLDQEIPADATGGTVDHLIAHRRTRLPRRQRVYASPAGGRRSKRPRRSISRSACAVPRSLCSSCSPSSVAAGEAEPEPPGPRVLVESHVRAFTDRALAVQRASSDGIVRQLASSPDATGGFYPRDGYRAQVEGGVATCAATSSPARRSRTRSPRRTRETRRPGRGSTARSRGSRRTCSARPPEPTSSASTTPVDTTSARASPAS